MNAIRWIPPVVPLAAVLPLLSSPGAAATYPLDDFETGPFFFSGFNAAFVPIPGYVSHAFWPERYIFLTSGQASLAVVPVYDDYVHMVLGPYEWCGVEYHLDSPFDLSFGGKVDRIDVTVSGIPDGEVRATVQDANGSLTSPAQILPDSNPITLSFPLSLWSSSRTSNATLFSVSFGGPASAATEYQLYDIRFAGPGSGPVNLNGSSTVTQIPPIPSSPLVFAAVDTSGGPLYTAEAVVSNATTDAQTVPAGDWTWSATPSLGGDVATLSFQWTDLGGILETEFDISVNVSPANGYLPDLYPPDPAYAPETIALNFPVAMRTGSGAVAGISDTWLTFDFDDRQVGSLEFQEVTVTENPAAASWTSGFTLHFRMAFSGMNTPDEQFPLFHATWTGDWTTVVPAVAAPEMPAGGAPLRLVAAPSITTRGTRIRASRPFERATTLLIHDVTGRRIRSLTAGAGTAMVAWDGRTEGGRAAAAGVYFVRTSDRSGAVARVVKAGVR